MTSATTRKADKMYANILDEFNGRQNTFFQEQTKKRQKLIKSIESERKKQTGHATSVITYTSKLDFPIPSLTMINQWDVKTIYTTLQQIPEQNDIEFIVHTHGGLPTKAKQMVELMRAKGRTLRVVIPEIAKSAGTLIALGSDGITLGTPSELGPIDPQVPRSVGGTIEYVPAWSYIESHKELLSKSTNPDGSLKQEYYPLLAAFDYPFYKMCDEVWKATRATAESFLQQGMYKRVRNKEEKAKKITKFFLEGFKPHDALIGPKEVSKTLGTNKVEILTDDNPLWQSYWELHIRTCVLLDVTSLVKHIEHSKAALFQQSQVQQQING